MRIPASERRSPEEIRRHYEIEVELAARLRCSSKQDRLRCYAEVYDELFRRVPTHPQLTRKVSEVHTRASIERQLGFLRRFLRSSDTFLEIGAGDCRLSFEIARQVRQVYAVDVSAEIMKNTSAPANCSLVLSDGCSVPVPPGSIDVAYSNQVMEHLHTDDAVEQLQNIHRALAPGGRYVCVTPNRLSGPHDVSRYFDEEARGFHMKEYTTGELVRLFESVGFRRAIPYFSAMGHHLPVAGTIAAMGEGLVGLPPAGVRRALSRRPPLRWLLGIQLVGIK